MNDPLQMNNKYPPSAKSIQYSAVLSYFLDGIKARIKKKIFQHVITLIIEDRYSKDFYSSYSL